ncbi:uncharacterized protein G2W53_013555 [Senna tora]|uniref:Uncharacterized protein n=1 Tax=Senna tora TaxID=362788 RepID=A0A834U0T8_9FABA|nr:uncharacterized protein G2W53_013555 [Senna tora]
MAPKKSSQKLAHPSIKMDYDKNNDYKCPICGLGSNDKKFIELHRPTHAMFEGRPHPDN